MGKIVLFQVDQGFEGGLAANFGPGRTAGPAMGRMWDSLAPLRQRGHDTVFAFTPVHPDFGGKILPLLDTLVGMGGRYCLDQFSSDTLVLPAAPWRQPYLQPYGVGLPFQLLKVLKDRHGPAFAGIRLHEYGFWWGWGLQNERGWLSDECQSRIPVDDDPLIPGLLLPAVRHMAGQGGWVCWSDPSTKPNAVPVVRQLTDQFPGCLIPTFANNLGNDVGHYWPVEIQPVVTPLTRGWGLSVQSWRWSKDGRGEVNWPQFVQWVQSARDAVLLEFEPAGYFWNVPIVYEPWTWQHDGGPTANLTNLLGVL